MLLGPVIDAPVEEWERMVQINLLGLLYCTHAALPHLLRAAEDSPRRVADLVNISSVAGRETRNGSGVYNATKHGVGAFSDALRKEITTRHVRVSLVEPGAVATELASHNRPEILAGMRQRFARSSASRPRTSPTRSHTSSPGHATSPSTKSSSARRNRSRPPVADGRGGFRGVVVGRRDKNHPLG